MTHREAVILSAYTDRLLTKNIDDVRMFCEELLGRPLLEPELCDPDVRAEICEKCLPLVKEIVDQEIA